jgi:hypothetical protein
MSIQNKKLFKAIHGIINVNACLDPDGTSNIPVINYFN